MSMNPTRDNSASLAYTDSSAGSSASPSPYGATSSMELDDDDLSKTVVLEPRDVCYPLTLQAAGTAQRCLTVQNPYGLVSNDMVVNGSPSSSSGLVGEGSGLNVMAYSQSSEMCKLFD